MKLIDTINRAGRSLKNAKARTLLTSLAIGVGAFTITLSLAAGEGGRGYTDQIVSANSDVREIVVTLPQPETSTGPREFDETGAVQSGPATGPLGGTADIVFITRDQLDDISTIEHVTEVIPNYSPSVTYITADGSKRFVVDSLSTFTPGLALEFAAGSVEDGNLGDAEIVLNEDYAEALFGSAEAAIGKTVEFRVDAQATLGESKMVPFTVKAVSSASGLAFRAQGSQLITANAARDLYDYISEGTRNYDKFILASVRIDEPGNAQAVKEDLIAKGFEAQTSADILGTINTFINVLQGILLGFGALAVLTSVFGIINTQYISVLERTQQIGLMKALGMRRRDVGRLFKLEAAWIGFLGGAIGAGLAVVAGVIANPIISEALSLDGIYLLSFNPIAVAGVVIGLMIVAVVSGIAPARKAAKLDPIEALRTE
ncbi:MAG: ABC transporter permease [Candidatus Saccharimonadota bacterium]|jgi:putative ABC transport system permease protein